MIFAREITRLLKKKSTRYGVELNNKCKDAKQSKNKK